MTESGGSAGSRQWGEGCGENTLFPKVLQFTVVVFGFCFKYWAIQAEVSCQLQAAAYTGVTRLRLMISEWAKGLVRPEILHIWIFS